VRRLHETWGREEDGVSASPLTSYLAGVALSALLTSGITRKKARSAPPSCTSKLRGRWVDFAAADVVHLAADAFHFPVLPASHRRRHLQLAREPGRLGKVSTGWRSIILSPIERGVLEGIGPG
jgi:hypothetical protein